MDTIVRTRQDQLKVCKCIFWFDPLATKLATLHRSAMSRSIYKRSSSAKRKIPIRIQASKRGSIRVLMRPSGWPWLWSLFAIANPSWFAPVQSTLFSNRDTLYWDLTMRTLVSFAGLVVPILPWLYYLSYYLLRQILSIALLHCILCNQVLVISIFLYFEKLIFENQFIDQCIQWTVNLKN